MRERTLLEQGTGRIQDFASQLDDIELMFELVEESGDLSQQEETDSVLEALYQKMERVRFEAYLSGEADQNHAFLEI